MFNRRCSLIIAAFLIAETLSCRIALAEIIKMKSGAAITGKIIYRTAKYIKIDFHNIFVSLYLCDIESIDGEALAVEDKIMAKDGPGVIADAFVDVKAAAKENSDASIKKDTGQARKINDRKLSVKLKGTEIRIALPKEWVNLAEYAEDEARPAAVFIRDYPKAEFDIFISDLGSDPLYDDREYQMRFLGSRRADLEKEAQGMGYEWISDRYSELFDVPCLIATYGPARRDIYFIKNYKLYTLKFRTKHREDFEKEWMGVERGIENIEFVKAG
ncbi:MAG: hypothetical protein Q8N91_04595 [Candidatus Omnitrophota bacterium]|nr:hypothetical protein [Candidatus Omnitrophota bacterium]